jgi:hypothetical protein
MSSGMHGEKRESWGVPRLSWDIGPAWVVAEDGDDDETLPWLPHAAGLYEPTACGGKVGMPAMWAALCAMATSAAIASEACFFLALSSLCRRLAFSTCRCCRSNSHSALVIPSGRSFSTLALLLAGGAAIGAAAIERGPTYFFDGTVAGSMLSFVGEWRE